MLGFFYMKTVWKRTMSTLFYLLIVCLLCVLEKKHNQILKTTPIIHVLSIHRERENVLTAFTFRHIYIPRSKREKKHWKSAILTLFFWDLIEFLDKFLSRSLVGKYQTDLEPINSIVIWKEKKKHVSKALRDVLKKLSVFLMQQYYTSCSSSYCPQQPKHDKGWNSKEEPWDKSQGYRNLEPDTWKIGWWLAVIQIFRIKNRHPSWWASSCQW